MRIRTPLAVVVALVAILAVGCGGQVGPPHRDCAPVQPARHRALRHLRAAGKASCRQEAEAFRPLLARRTAHCGNLGGFLSRCSARWYGGLTVETGQTHALLIS